MSLPYRSLEMFSSSDAAWDIRYTQEALRARGVCAGAVLLLSFQSQRTAMGSARLVSTYRGRLVLRNERVCSTV